MTEKQEPNNHNIEPLLRLDSTIALVGLIVMLAGMHTNDNTLAVLGAFMGLNSIRNAISLLDLRK